MLVTPSMKTLANLFFFNITSKSGVIFHLWNGSGFQGQGCHPVIFHQCKLMLPSRLFLHRRILAQDYFGLLESHRHMIGSTQWCFGQWEDGIMLFLLIKSLGVGRRNNKAYSCWPLSLYFCWVVLEAPKLILGKILQKARIFINLTLLISNLTFGDLSLGSYPSLSPKDFEYTQ